MRATCAPIPHASLLTVGEIDADDDSIADGDGLTLREPVADALASGECEASGESEIPDASTEGDGSAVTTVGVTVRVSDAHAVLVCDALGEALGEVDALGEEDAHGEADGLRDVDALCEDDAL